MGSYAFLKERFARLFRLEQEIARMTWRQVSGKPNGGARRRSSASIGGEISGLLRDPETDGAMRRGLDELHRFSPEQQKDLLFWHSRWWRVSRLPKPLVEALSAACEECKSAWGEARRVDDFATVLPAFRRVVSLTREKADLWKEPSMTRYDALLDVYDPGQRAAALAERHGWLEDAAWNDDGEGEERNFFDRNAWRQPVETIAGICGFDLERGRIDLGTHSMTLTAGANDVRLLLSEKLGRSALTQLLHEIGHGKLEQELKRHPLWSWRAHAPSQAFHERAARSHEETGCASIEQYLLRGAHHLGKQFEQSFHAHAELPSPTVRSSIRLESSGTWFEWHIWVRYKIERDLIGNGCQPENLPEIWNQLIPKRTGMMPANLREGCLQDIQWFMGLFGYFPIYWEAAERPVSARFI